MIHNLDVGGEYIIPQGRTYVCDMKLFIYTPYKL
jgi:hypothetical protein